MIGVADSVADVAESLYRLALGKLFVGDFVGTMKFSQVRWVTVRLTAYTQLALFFM